MPTPKLELAIQFAVKKSRRPRRADIRRWAKAALKVDAMVALRVVDTDEARELNREYRGKDYATNVLTFAYGAVEDDTPLNTKKARRSPKSAKPATTPLTGDIVICASVVAREAKEQGISCQAHYAHLVVHGMLHLQGYDHKIENEAVIMESIESFIMQRLGYADPYAAECDAAAPAAKS